VEKDNLKEARKFYLLALRCDPENPKYKEALSLLDEYEGPSHTSASSRSVEEHPQAEKRTGPQADWSLDEEILYIFETMDTGVLLHTRLFTQ